MLRRPGTYRAPLVVAIGVVCAVLLSGCTVEAIPAVEVAGGSVERGRVAIREHGCGSCHMIPGLAGADGLVGPPLDHWARRGYIAGNLPNTPENLIAWLMDPQAIEPGTAMPTVPISEAEARDMATYLYTLR